MHYTICCFSVLTALALPIAVTAYLNAPELDNGALDNAGDFMAYCSDAAHGLACNGRVHEGDENNTVFPSDKCASAMPDANNSETYEANAQLVVVWIVGHYELASDSTDDTIKRDELTLWPCRQWEL